MKIGMIGVAVLGIVTGADQARAAGLDWGGDCASGSATNALSLEREKSVAMGYVPRGKDGVLILLNSDVDTDLQLVDRTTGEVIVGWPDGVLKEGGEACASHGSAGYCWSGFDGIDGNAGQEYILVQGATDRDLEIRAFGYEAGVTEVYYQYQPVSTCRERGEGLGTGAVTANGYLDLGSLVAGKVNAVIEIDSTQDLDIQLLAGSAMLVGWPNGTLNGKTEAALEVGAATIIYSGYAGVGGKPGRERLEIMGPVPAGLSVRVFGYKAGSATVRHTWGEGAGATCGGIANLSCDDGFECKQVMANVTEPAGSCHSTDWCLSGSTAMVDCAGAPAPQTAGMWGCETFRCAWVACPAFVDCEGGTCQPSAIEAACPNTLIGL